MTMSEIVVGIVAGVVVALASQVISHLFDRRKKRQEEDRREKAVLALLRHEVEHHQHLYEHHIPWAEESIEKGGPEHTGYSYSRAKTDVYDKVFLVYWHLLPDEIVRSAISYYSAVHVFNTVSGEVGRPSDVPIAGAKEIMERAQKGADALMRLLEKCVPSPKPATW
jgi:hypothetical protein